MGFSHSRNTPTEFKKCSGLEFSKIFFQTRSFERCMLELKYRGGAIICLHEPQKLTLLDKDGEHQQISIRHVIKNYIECYEIHFDTEIHVSVYHNKIDLKSPYEIVYTYPFKDDLESLEYVLLKFDTIQTCRCDHNIDTELMNEILSYPVVFSEQTFMEKNASRDKSGPIFLVKNRREKDMYLVTPYVIIVRNNETLAIKIYHVDEIYYVSEYRVIYRLDNVIYNWVFESIVDEFNYPVPTFDTVSVLTKDGVHQISKLFLESFNSEYLNNEMKENRVRLPGVTRDQISHSPFFYGYIGSNPKDRNEEKYRQWIHERIWSLEIEEE